MLNFTLCFSIYHYPIIACCKVATIDLSLTLVQLTVFAVHESIKMCFL